MKEKRMKGSTRKVLLMGVAAVLVAAISVGATLAYLTAQTGSVTNTFKGSGGITAQFAEPKYDGDGTFTIGQPNTKDPLIENTTEDAAIYVGTRVSFWISTDGTNYSQVTPTTFYKYVDVQYNNVAATSYNTGTTGATWTKKTDDVKNAGELSDHDCEYFVYNKVLLQKDSDPSYTGGSGAYSATAYETTKDNTAPLFTSVKVKAAVTLQAGGTSTVTSAAAAALTGTDDAGPSGKTFEKFNYKIVLDGYGVKAYAVDSSGNMDGAALCTLADAQIEITAKLTDTTLLPLSAS